MGALADRAIAAAERQTGCDMPYLRTLADASGGAFARWMLTAPAAQYRKRAPLDAWHLARLGATVAQDCGTCVQLVVTVAQRDGVSATTLRQALDAPDDLYGDARAAYAFGHAVTTGSGNVADRVAEVEALFGHEAHVELAMAVALCQIYPAIKRGLGQSLACSLVTIEME